MVAVCIRATGSASAVSVVMSHAPPTFCIQTPMLPIVLADHSARKAGSLSGWRTDSDGGLVETGVGLGERKDGTCLPRCSHVQMWVQTATLQVVHSRYVVPGRE